MIWIGDSIVSIKEKCLLIQEELQKLYPTTETFLHFNTDWQLLFAVILSAQATDNSVNEATERMFKELPELTDYNENNRLLIHDCVKKVGLGNSKTEYLLKTAKILIDEYSGIVPRDRKILQTFPGVGYKTSGVVLAEFYNDPYIPVDTHVYRVTHRLGIVKNISPDDTEKRLEKLFTVPSNIHLHRQFILFGREICKARNEECQLCPFKDICNYYQKKKPK